MRGIFNNGCDERACMYVIDEVSNPASDQYKQKLISKRFQ